MRPLPTLPPRHAEHLYWMARYLERALCRAMLVLDMQGAFGPATALWDALPACFDEDDIYRAAPAGLSVPDFYKQATADHSVPGMIAQARDNARIVRPILPESFWEMLRAVLAECDAPGEFFYGAARSGLLALAGLADRFLYRGDGWMMFRLGQLLERAEQTLCVFRLVPPADPVLAAAWARHLPGLLGGAGDADHVDLLTSHDSPTSPVFNLLRAEALLRQLAAIDLAGECRRGAAQALDTPAVWIAAQQKRLDHIHRGILDMLSN